MGFITDFIRLIWASFYWNLRKSIFRFSKGKKRSPCQSDCDSGRGGETGCDACLQWRNPARFRAVCPLLVKNERRWVCSVDAEKVRPFWTRTLGIWSLLLVLSWAALSGSVFTTMRVIGFPVTFAMVGWPGNWSQISKARSQYYFNEAKEALDSSNVSKATISLGLAVQLDPDNYETSMMLADMLRMSHPAGAEAIFRHNFNTHPDHRTEVARQWVRLLLVQRNYTGVAELARVILSAPTKDTETIPWLNAFAFALGKGAPHHLVTDLLSQSKLSPEIAPFVQTLNRQYQLSGDDISAFLVQTCRETRQGYTVIYCIRELMPYGNKVSTVDLLEEKKALLSSRDYWELRLDALASVGWSSLRDSEFHTLLENTRDQTSLEMLCTHLIRYPQTDLGNELFDALPNLPIPGLATNLDAHLALFCVACAQQSVQHVKQEKQTLQAISQRSFIALDKAEDAFLHSEGTEIDLNFLTYLPPMPLNALYAILDKDTR